MSDDLEKIYRKFFDDSGKMKEAGTNILKKGMSDLIKQVQKSMFQKHRLKAFDEAD
jgi:hypothetical protein